MTANDLLLVPLDGLLKVHGVRHFTAREVVQLWRPPKHGATVTLPPPELWWHIIPTLHILDAVREVVGPIKILSGYRPPEYNAAVGGAKDSMHMHFCACDWRPVQFDEWTIADLNDVLTDVTEGAEKFMGIGTYPDKNPNDHVKTGFIHTDTRGLVLGRAGARWEG